MYFSFLFPIQIQQTMASLADIQQMMEEMLSRQETRFAQAIENQRQTLLGEVRNMLPPCQVLLTSTKRGPINYSINGNKRTAPL